MPKKGKKGLNELDFYSSATHFCNALHILENGIFRRIIRPHMGPTSRQPLSDVILVSLRVS